MFISKIGHGYYDNAGQHSGRGYYLILFSWNTFKAADEIVNACLACQCQKHANEFARHNYAYVCRPWEFDESTVTREELARRWNAVFNRSDKCPAHAELWKIDGPLYPQTGQGKLWAAVRVCALHQFGPFMMGVLRIGRASITVLGSIGSDGLPLDLQKVPENFRSHLVQVPYDIAREYWADNGWNDIGKARGPLTDWAKTAFPEVFGRKRQ